MDSYLETDGERVASDTRHTPRFAHCVKCGYRATSETQDDESPLCEAHGGIPRDRMPSVAKIIAYESGDMTEEQEIEFMQELIDTGWAWRLQGCYGRAAQSMIDAGLCVRSRGASS